MITILCKSKNVYTLRMLYLITFNLHCYFGRNDAIPLRYCYSYKANDTIQ